MKHFKNLSGWIDFINQIQPDHPQLHIINYANNKKVLEQTIKDCPPVTRDFYSISLKKVLSGDLNYGRTKYDFQSGTMLFLAPRQVVSWNNLKLDDNGFKITFHEDFIKGYPLDNKIKQYNFFNYSANEALHLSEKEERMILTAFSNIESEYYNNQDEFSKKIIISHIETILNYSERFYKRQFLNREELNKDLSYQFNKILNEYYSDNLLKTSGIPKIDWFAEKLSLSSHYISDSLKTQTGRSATSHINEFIISKAKDMLIQPNISISETAYNLGFEYPQYFSRLFKKKTGMSPKEYIKSITLN